MTSTTTNLETKKPEVRAKRVPFGQKTSRLEVNKIPEGFRLAWVNDDGVRLHQALESGYMFATPEDVARSPREDNKVSEYGGLKQDGSPMLTYLLKIQTEYYLEDEAIGKKRLDAIDAAIRGGKIGNNPSDSRYIPASGISVK